MLAANTLLQKRYLLERPIGRGGMGTVYRAIDQRLGHTVAVKQILGNDPRLVAAFEREARILARLRHPNLPAVTDYFVEDAGRFLVMEFIPGDDLATLLQRNGGPFSPADVLHWGNQLLDALDYLHSQQPPVIHRDIKPQNLKLTNRGTIVLLDFGLARGEAGITSTGSSLLGYTPGFAPPEQIHGEGTDPRSDLYALAVTLYMLMTDVKPPDAPHRMMEVLDGKSDPVQPAHELAPHVHPALSAVLLRAMALPPEQRPAGAKAMREALARIGAHSSPRVTRVLPETAPEDVTMAAGMQRDTSPAAAPGGTHSALSTVPSGTVTFLFTDIEGSTRLWEQQPQAMHHALARHDAILRQQIEGHGGFVFKTVGDAFCAAFADALNALEAALAAQRALHQEAWNGIEALKVRMALHTGAVERRDGDYFGPTLNRVARLLATGYGGQILLARAAQELVRDTLPPGVSLRDLGEHRLKDLTRSERIFQVVVADLPPDFPPLKTLDKRPTNLPAQPTPLIGRDREMAHVCILLRNDNVRLVTLTGPGGTGKTRLGLQVAAELLDEYIDGVFFVALASLHDPDLVVTTIAQTLGLHEDSNRPLIETLTTFLRDRQILLILDNFEQVIPAAPVIGELLAAAPGVKILVTSREVLHIYGEHEFPVPPLELPNLKQLPPVVMLANVATIALFMQRAQAIRPDFALTVENAPIVANICARLDGLPLAIELAAARIKLLPPRAILDRLTNRLKLLIGGARDLPTRQQTLRGTIDWSYNLLTTDEQTLFARLVVFVGGCSLEAVEAVCNATGDLEIDELDGLASLVDKSLLRQEEGIDGEPRFTMLETIREYALERLTESGVVTALSAQHATFFTDLAEQAEPELTGPQQVVWLNRLEQEHDNLRAALEWALTSGAAEIATRLGAALWRFWWTRGHLTAGRRRLTQVLEHSAAVAPRLRARALDAAGVLVHSQCDYAQAVALYEESLALWQQLGDKEGTATVLNNLGIVANEQGDYVRARAFYEQSLALRRELGDDINIAKTLINLGTVAHDQGDYRQAETAYQESLALFQTLGDKWSITLTLSNLANLALSQNDYQRATRCAEAALVLSRELGDRVGIAHALSNLAHATTYQHDHERAIALYQESLLNFYELQDRSGVAECLEGLASVSAAQGNSLPAIQLWSAAEALRDAIGAPLAPADRAAYDRQLATARAHLDETTLAAAQARGRAMSLEQVLAYVLEILRRNTLA